VRRKRGSYPAVWGVDVSAYKPLYEALSKHTVALLKDPEKRNFFPDGGIRLSSTSDNSWMSKIALFQYVCTKVLKIDADPAIRQSLAGADAAHVKWMTEGESAYWACSDQFVSGVAKGSKYYPRIVTSVLWM
jgi:xylan 1,4-beta-xylosidase